jgi:hypothetical protein
MECHCLPGEVMNFENSQGPNYELLSNEIYSVVSWNVELHNKSQTVSLSLLDQAQ